MSYNQTNVNTLIKKEAAYQKALKSGNKERIKNTKTLLDRLWDNVRNENRPQK